MKDLQTKMLEELESKNLFRQAQEYAFNYIDSIQSRDVFPSDSNIKLLEEFVEPLQENTLSAKEVIEKLETVGAPGTTAQLGGRYFGFVNGSAVPAALGAKWMSDVWDQNGGLYLTSPLNAKLETVCEMWLKDIFALPQETAAGFVSGTSMANLCAIAAARFRILKNLDWDVNQLGLNGAPKVRIITHTQIHASIKKTLALLGFGLETIEWVPSDAQGRISVDAMPKLDASSIVILQAGNANTGAFDDFKSVISIAKNTGAWVHVDGAFGLWAAAVEQLKYLTKDFHLASSWSVDGHKSLNTPYDSGVVLCKDKEALLSALQATGEYIILSDARDPLLYGPEMSKRSRAIELWATMKYLGKEGIRKLMYSFHETAQQLEKGLKEIGFNILNEVVFNQVLVSAASDEETKHIIKYIQDSRQCWLGGTTWKNKPAIRISICSWMTQEKDIELLIELFKKGRENFS